MTYLVLPLVIILVAIYFVALNKKKKSEEKTDLDTLLAIENKISDVVSEDALNRLFEIVIDIDKNHLMDENYIITVDKVKDMIKNRRKELLQENNN